MKIKIDELRNKIEKVLSSKYYSAEQAKAIAEVLVYAELTGKNTQGIVKLSGTQPIQNIKPKSEPKIIKETKLSVLIDGGGNPGALVSHMATKKVIEKCDESGFGIVGTNNTFSSTGVIGFYANEISKHGFIGIIMSGSPGAVAPFGGIDPVFGTNPIAFGLPTQEWPIIFDMATSAITWYGLVRAKALGQKIPEGLAIDHKGNLTIDPDEAMKGAILPFDKSYKGSGLCLMVEVFTGPLVGAAFADYNYGDGDWGNVFIAIDPELLIGREEFKKQNSELIKRVKSSRKAKGADKIHIPGWKGMETKEKLEREGEVEIEDELLKIFDS